MMGPDAREPLVYVVDDDAAVRDAIALLLRSVRLKVETYASAAAFLAAFDARPHPRRACLVTDVRMPGMSGHDLQDALAHRPSGHIPMIFISGHADVPQAVRAMRAGALTFLEKPVNEQDLIDTIHQALRMPAFDERANSGRTVADQRALLTERQRDVFDQLMKGLQTKEVAKSLGLSHRTVEVHRAKILQRLGATSVSQLLRQVLAQSGPH